MHLSSFLTLSGPMKSCILAVLFSVSSVRAQAQIQQYPYFQSQEFDEGKLGPYPNRTYITEPTLISPRLNVLQSDPRCNDGKYTMISLRGDKVALKGQSPMIHDARGNLVWMNSTYGETFGLAVQKYKGEDYLTFWQGDDSVGGHGEGYYYMLDSSYREAFRITAGEGKPGDLHEFHITKENTALITQYINTPAEFGHRHGYIWDSVIQEIDIETNKVIFEWKASEHFEIDHSYFQPGNAGRNKDSGYDFFHINSIDKDSAGNYLISSRYYKLVAYINGITGDVLWTIGGREHVFKDLSEGKATNFAWQHDARWNSDHTGITLFDNSARYGMEPSKEYSRGMEIELDFRGMTVRLKREFINPRRIISASQGGMQVLESGNVLIGYGYNAAWTEFSADGEVLCDVHIGSQHTFNTGAVQTYKVGKYEWVGKPSEKPKVEWKKGWLWVSWNGATEVKKWIVKGSVEVGGGMMDVSTVVKMGFETRVEIDCGLWTEVRVVGVNGKGEVLGETDVVLVTCMPSGYAASIQPAINAIAETQLKWFFHFLGVAATAVGVWSLWKWTLKRRAHSILYHRVGQESILG